MPHNVENPVTFQQAAKELNCSGYYLSAVRNKLGIRSRIFMLSTIRDFIRDNPGFTAFGHYRGHAKKKRLNYEFDGAQWVVTSPTLPDVIAQDKSLPKALAQAGKQVESISNETLAK